MNTWSFGLFFYLCFAVTIAAQRLASILDPDRAIYWDGFECHAQPHFLTTGGVLSDAASTDDPMYHFNKISSISLESDIDDWDRESVTVFNIQLAKAALM